MQSNLEQASKKDYYAILEVSKDATLKQIIKAYRKLSLRWHPDKNNNSNESKEKFQDINEAYSVLSDATKRLAYDKGWVDNTKSSIIKNYQSKEEIINDLNQATSAETIRSIINQINMNTWADLLIDCIQKNPEIIGPNFSLVIRDIKSLAKSFFKFKGLREWENIAKFINTLVIYEKIKLDKSDFSILTKKLCKYAIDENDLKLILYLGTSIKILIPDGVTLLDILKTLNDFQGALFLPFSKRAEFLGILKEKMPFELEEKTLKIITDWLCSISSFTPVKDKVVSESFNVISNFLGENRPSLTHFGNDSEIFQREKENFFQNLSVALSAISPLYWCQLDVLIELESLSSANQLKELLNKIDPDYWIFIPELPFNFNIIILNRDDFVKFYQNTKIQDWESISSFISVLAKRMSLNMFNLAILVENLSHFASDCHYFSKAVIRLIDELEPNSTLNVFNSLKNYPAHLRVRFLENFMERPDLIRNDEILSHILEWLPAEDENAFLEWMMQQGQLTTVKHKAEEENSVTNHKHTSSPLITPYQDQGYFTEQNNTLSFYKTNTKLDHSVFRLNVKPCFDPNANNGLKFVIPVMLGLRSHPLRQPSGIDLCILEIFENTDFNDAIAYVTEKISAENTVTLTLQAITTSYSFFILNSEAKGFTITKKTYVLTAIDNIELPHAIQVVLPLSFFIDHVSFEIYNEEPYPLDAFENTSFYHAKINILLNTWLYSHFPGFLFYQEGEKVNKILLDLWESIAFYSSINNGYNRYEVCLIIIQFFQVFLLQQDKFNGQDLTSLSASLQKFFFSVSPYLLNFLYSTYQKWLAPQLQKNDLSALEKVFVDAFNQLFLPFSYNLNPHLAGVNVTSSTNIPFQENLEQPSSKESFVEEEKPIQPRSTSFKPEFKEEEIAILQNPENCTWSDALQKKLYNEASPNFFNLLREVCTAEQFWSFFTKNNMDKEARYDFVFHHKELCNIFWKDNQWEICVLKKGKWNEEFQVLFLYRSLLMANPEYHKQIKDMLNNASHVLHVLALNHLLKEKGGIAIYLFVKPLTEIYHQLKEGLKLTQETAGRIEKIEELLKNHRNLQDELNSTSSNSKDRKQRLDKFLLFSLDKLLFHFFYFFSLVDLAERQRPSSLLLSNADYCLERVGTEDQFYNLYSSHPFRSSLASQCFMVNSKRRTMMHGGRLETYFSSMTISELVSLLYQQSPFDPSRSFGNPYFIKYLKIDAFWLKDSTSSDEQTKNHQLIVANKLIRGIANCINLQKLEIVLGEYSWAPESLYFLFEVLKSLPKLNSIYFLFKPSSEQELINLTKPCEQLIKIFILSPYIRAIKIDFDTSGIPYSEPFYSLSKHLESYTHLWDIHSGTWTLGFSRNPACFLLPSLKKPENLDSLDEIDKFLASEETFRSRWVSIYIQEMGGSLISLQQFMQCVAQYPINIQILYEPVFEHIYNQYILKLDRDQQIKFLSQAYSLSIPFLQDLIADLFIQYIDLSPLDFLKAFLFLSMNFPAINAEYQIHQEVCLKRWITIEQNKGDMQWRETHLPPKILNFFKKYPMVILTNKGGFEVFLSSFQSLFFSEAPISEPMHRCIQTISSPFAVKRFFEEMDKLSFDQLILLIQYLFNKIEDKKDFSNHLNFKEKAFLQGKISNQEECIEFICGLIAKIIGFGFTSLLAFKSGLLPLFIEEKELITKEVFAKLLGQDFSLTPAIREENSTAYLTRDIPTTENKPLVKGNQEKSNSNPNVERLTTTNENLLIQKAFYFLSLLPFIEKELTSEENAQVGWLRKNLHSNQQENYPLIAKNLIQLQSQIIYPFLIKHFGSPEQKVTCKYPTGNNQSLYILSLNASLTHIQEWVKKLISNPQCENYIKIEEKKIEEKIQFFEEIEKVQDRMLKFQDRDSIERRKQELEELTSCYQSILNFIPKNPHEIKENQLFKKDAKKSLKIVQYELNKLNEILNFPGELPNPDIIKKHLEATQNSLNDLREKKLQLNLKWKAIVAWSQQDTNPDDFFKNVFKFTEEGLGFDIENFAVVFYFGIPDSDLPPKDLKLLLEFFNSFCHYYDCNQSQAFLEKLVKLEDKDKLYKGLHLFFFERATLEEAMQAIEHTRRYNFNFPLLRINKEDRNILQMDIPNLKEEEKFDIKLNKS